MVHGLWIQSEVVDDWRGDTKEHHRATRRACRQEALSSRLSPQSDSKPHSDQVIAIVTCFMFIQSYFIDQNIYKAHTYTPSPPPICSAKIFCKSAKVNKMISLKQHIQNASSA